MRWKMQRQIKGDGREIRARDRQTKRDRERWKEQREIKGDKREMGERQTDRKIQRETERFEEKSIKSTLNAKRSMMNGVVQEKKDELLAKEMQNNNKTMTMRMIIIIIILIMVIHSMLSLHGMLTHTFDERN